MKQILHKLSKISNRSRSNKIVKISDPIHKFINISGYPVIQQIIDTSYFQRLRGLHQLGFASYVYPNATHSRFSHSIGVMHTFSILFDSVAENSNLSKRKIERLRPLGLVAALLHDIGHGPFSHASEKFLHNGAFDHENLTQDIIRKTEIKDVLVDNDIEPQTICDILAHKVSGEFKFVSQLISSQLDADRLDYLARDALFTGVPYGNIDTYRIANTLSIWDHDSPKKSLKGTIVVSEKGIEAVENYLLGRYHMYSKVYRHKTILGIENMLAQIFIRASKFPKEYSKFADISKKVTPSMMLSLDDHVCYSAIREWSKSSDRVLCDLSTRLIYRRLLKTSLVNEESAFKKFIDCQDKLRIEFKKKKFDFKYYFMYDSGRKLGYDAYTATTSDDEQTAISHIMIKTEEGDLKEISEVSKLVNAISTKNNPIRIFYPQELSSVINKMTH